MPDHHLLLLVVLWPCCWVLQPLPGPAWPLQSWAGTPQLTRLAPAAAASMQEWGWCSLAAWGMRLVVVLLLLAGLLF